MSEINEVAIGMVGYFAGYSVKVVSVRRMPNDVLWIDLSVLKRSRLSFLIRVGPRELQDLFHGGNLRLHPNLEPPERP